MPNISMIGEIGKDVELDISSDIFWKCAQGALLRIREGISRKRKMEIEKLKRKK